MSGEVVRVKTQWTAEQLLLARRHYFRHQCRPVFFLMIVAVFALAFLLGLYDLVTRGISMVNLALVLVGIYVFALRPWERRWQAKRTIDKEPGMKEAVEWEFSESGAICESASGRGELKWTAFPKAVFCRDGVLLLSTTTTFHWFPVGLFASPEEYGAFAALVDANVTEVYDASRHRRTLHTESARAEM